MDHSASRSGRALKLVGKNSMNLIERVHFFYSELFDIFDSELVNLGGSKKMIYSTVMS